MDDVALLEQVGSRLRAFRQALGLTLADLAARTDLTPSTISRLERGGVKPTLEQLLPLSRVYGVPLDELVAAPRVGDPRVHLRPVRRDGLTFIPLGINQGELQAYKVLYPPASSLPAPRLRTHPGREWVYVLSGLVRLVVADRRTDLAAGEAAEFDTRVPHWIGNAEETRPAEVLAIFGKQGQRMHFDEP